MKEKDKKICPSAGDKRVETDIADIRRPPSKYPKMSLEDRAKQFGAFDPLAGLSEALRKKEEEI